MKKLGERERRRQLEALAKMPDAAIDTSDIPELTSEEMERGLVGLMYRPVKRPVTMRLDADVIEWLKAQGPGYQTRANRILRTAMVHARRKRTGGRMSPSASKHAGASPARRLAGTSKARR